MEGKIGRRAGARGVSVLPTGLVPVEGKIGRKTGAPGASILPTELASVGGKIGTKAGAWCLCPPHRACLGGREDWEEGRRAWFFSISFTHDARSWGSSASALPTELASVGGKIGTKAGALGFSQSPSPTA